MGATSSRLWIKVTAYLRQRFWLFLNVNPDFLVFIECFSGPSGNPAPIEMRAHDAQIYVTDMLVWINKAIPVEKQNLHSLVKMCNHEGK